MIGGNGTAISVAGDNATVADVSVNNNTGDSILVNVLRFPALMVLISMLFLMVLMCLVLT